MLYPLSYEGVRVDPSCVVGVSCLGPVLVDLDWTKSGP